MPSQGASRLGDLSASLFQDTSSREAYSPGRIRSSSLASILRGGRIPRGRRPIRDRPSGRDG
jgi:hypothetical protein